MRMKATVKRVPRTRIPLGENQSRSMEPTQSTDHTQYPFHNALYPSSNATTHLAYSDIGLSSDISSNQQQKQPITIKQTLSNRISNYAPIQTNPQLRSKSTPKESSFPLCRTTRKQKFLLLAAFLAIVVISCVSILTPVLILRQKTNSESSSSANISVSMCSRSTCIGQETPYRSSMTTRLYTFDGNLYDSTATVAGTSLGVPPSISFTLVGMASLAYYMSLFNFQYVSIPYVNLSQQSFTFQIWIVPYVDNTTADVGIFGQCGSTDNICFSLSLRNNHIVVSFDAANPNDVPLISSAIIPFYIWTHVTVVYDAVALQQLIYINGRVDTATAKTVRPYRGTSVGSSNTTIGFSSSFTSPVSYYTGYIDQLTISSGSVRSACQILNDATLMVYFPFDATNQLIDQSNYNNYGYTSNVFTFSSGHINQALLFNSSTSYFQSQCYPTIRTTMPFTMSLWLYPTGASGGTIVHLSVLQNGTGTPCYDLLAMTSTGNIVVQLMTTVTNVTDLLGPILPNNTWTHIAVVYGYTSGMRLYVNGALAVMSRPYVSIPVYTYAPLFLTLANTNPRGPAYSVNCPGGSSTGYTPGAFSGAIDDFRLYIRELDGQEICVLANM